MVRLSWYDPGLCGELPLNCFDVEDAFRMAGGEDAREWYGRSVACPLEFELGTEFEVVGSRNADGGYVCKDRGGAIFIEEGGVVRLDVLSLWPIWTGLAEARVSLGR